MMVHNKKKTRISMIRRENNDKHRNKTNDNDDDNDTYTIRDNGIKIDKDYGDDNEEEDNYQ